MCQNPTIIAPPQSLLKLHLHAPKLPKDAPCRMSLNCQDTTTMHVVKLQTPVPLSGCMMLNCPPHHSMLPEHSSRAHGPRDCLRTDDMTYSASTGTPYLDLSSSMDSIQTHDSLVTPESPPYLPSPTESLEEGTEEPVTQVGTNDQVTQVRTDDSLAYDSLITTLLQLSLEPKLDPLSDHQ